MAGVLRSYTFTLRQKAAEDYIKRHNSVECSLVFTNYLGKAGAYHKYLARLSEPSASFLRRVVVLLRDEAPLGKPMDVSGSLQRPREALNPGEFDERDYLLGKGVYFSLYAQILHVGEGRLRNLCGLRGFLCEKIDEEFSQKEGDILKAFLTGDKGYMDGLEKRAFDLCGLYRFIGISSFHISCCYFTVKRLFDLLLRKRGAGDWAGLLTALFLSSMAGLSAGTLRVMVFLSMRVFAPRFRRRYQPIAALSLWTLLTAFFIPNPFHDPGFLIGFSGVLGAWYGERFLKKCGGRFFGALFFLIVATAHIFGEVTLAHLLFGWLYSFFLAGVLPFTLFSFIPRLKWISYLFLKGLSTFAHWGAGFLGFWFSLPAPSFMDLIALSLLLGLRAYVVEERISEKGFYISSESSKLKRNIKCAVAFIAAMVLFFSSLGRVYSYYPEIVFLAVGQGDCALIRYKGSTIIIDTGTESAFNRVVAPYLRRRGITKIDLVILSHLHSDHAGGWPQLYEEFSPKALIAPTGDAKEAIELIHGFEAEVEELFEHEVSSNPGIGDLPLRIFACAPQKDLDDFTGDENERCLVLTLQFFCGEGIPLIAEFWADADGKTVKSTLVKMREQEGWVRVVKTPHHGSRLSNVPGLFQDVSLAVVSVGPNSYGHPSKEMLESAQRSSVPLLRTDENGAVTVKVRRGKVICSSFTGRELGF